MTIAEILAAATTAYAELKKSAYEKKVSYADAANQLDPLKHLIFDAVKRPRREIDKPTGEKDADGDAITKKVTVDVNRLPVGFQRLILTRAVGFIYGNAIKLSANPVSTQDQELFALVEDCITNNKLNYFRQKRARTLFAECEVATLWYLVDNPTAKGDEPKLSLKCKLLSESLGDKVYPHLDEYGDWDACTHEYKVKVDGKDITFIDVYTNDTFYYYTLSSGTLVPREKPSETNAAGKIPIVLSKIEVPVWYPVQPLIERYESRFSNTADTNDYNGDPLLLIRGDTPEWFEKGETGKAVQTGTDGGAAYVTYDSMSDSVTFEMKTLKELIYTLTQTPDISFEAMKAIGGDVSGVALKLMFMDAHLAAQDRWEVLGEMEQRELNIIKTMIGKAQVSKLANSVQTLSIEPIMTPYSPVNRKEDVTILTIANGGKAIISQQKSIEESGFGYDTVEEMTQLAVEAKADAELASGSIMGGMQ